MPHLSYVGDATIGEGANIGAATVFVNYDGVDKHHTTVGDHARVGSDTMLVAPLTIGDGAYTAAGSVIVNDVPRRDGRGTRPPAQRRGLGDPPQVRHQVGRGGPAGPRRRFITVQGAGSPAYHSVSPGPGGASRMSGIQTMGQKNLMFFSGRAYPQLAEEVARNLGVEITPTSLRDFANGEIYVRYLESVRGCDAFVIQSHTAPINQWIMEQLIMVDALKRASAKRVTVIMPFFGYARQDKKGRGREPITARLMADMFKQAGADRLMSIDLHTSQIQGFFDGPVDHLFAMPILINYLRDKIDPATTTIVSPGHRPGAPGGTLVGRAGHAGGLHPQAA